MKQPKQWYLEWGKNGSPRRFRLLKESISARYGIPFCELLVRKFRGPPEQHRLVLLLSFACYSQTARVFDEDTADSGFRTQKSQAGTYLKRLCCAGVAKGAAGKRKVITGLDHKWKLNAAILTC